MADVKIVVGAQDNASRVLASVRNSLSDLERSAVVVGNALGVIGGAGVAGFAALARNAINSVDALNDLADATGASVENISALEDIAARTGTSFDTVGTALVKFNAQLKDAKPGSGAEQALTALGLSVKELKALDPAEALLKTSIALDGFADDANKARLVQELFGKSIKDVAPLLKDLAEKGQLTATVTTEQAKAAEAFNKQVFELQKNVTDAARAMALDLLPVISEIVKEFAALNAAQSGVNLTGGLLKTAFEATAVTGANVSFVLKSVGREIGAIAAQGAALARGDFAGFSAISDAVKADGVAARAELDLLEKRILGTVAKVQSLPARPGQSNSGLPSLPEIDLETVRKQKDRLDQLARNKELLRKLELATRKEQEKEAQDELDAIERSIKAVERRNEEFLKGLLKENEALSQSNQKQRDQLEEIALTKEELNALTLARLDNTIATEQATLAISNAMGVSYEEISALEQKIALLKEQRDITAQSQVRQAQADTKAEQAKASKDYADTLRNDLKGAFSAAFRDSESPLKAFGDALENVIFTRASTALAESLAEAAAQQFATSSGGLGGLGSFFSDLLSFDGGGSTGSGSRTGGLDGKGGFMAMLHPQETVLDHTMGQTAAGGGTVNITQNISIDSRSDQATILAAMNQAKEMAKAEILRSRQRGGSFA
jgi:hypothetical protein